MKYEIKNRWDGSLIYSTESDSWTNGMKIVGKSAQAGFISF